METLAKRGRLSATGISDSFSVSSPAISQHLGILLGAHLIRVERHGRMRMYTINSDAMLDLEAWLKKTREEWGKRFDALDALLIEKKHKK